MSTSFIDLRSDVVAQPTEAMRDAMRNARLGAYLDNEDPTVDALERACAARFGKEAALFLPSATMANLIACMHYCRPGEQVIVDQDAHVYRNEFAGLTRAGGVLPRVVARDDALPALDGVQRAMARRNAAEDPVRLLWVENTHNVGGGAIASPGQLADLRDALQGHDVAIHMDGARVFNAAVGLGVPVADLARHVDSISVGFNKGLACPAGCVLVGDHSLVEGARKLRRMLGGRLTKAGVLAAACLVALETMIERLAEDHAVARQLAEAIESVPGLQIEAPVITNIVRFDCGELCPASQFASALADNGLGVGAVGATVIRAVTHRHITQETMARATDVLRATVASLPERPIPVLAT